MTLDKAITRVMTELSLPDSFKDYVDRACTKLTLGNDKVDLETVKEIEQWIRNDLRR